MKIGTGAELRAIDAYSIIQIGIPGAVLMERAALSAYEELLKLDILKKNVTIICGEGNNGGDGYVIARLLRNICNVKLYITGAMSKVKNDAFINLNILNNLGVAVEELNPDTNTNKNSVQDLINCDFLIDCIFGTGLSKNISGLHKNIIEKMNSSEAYKIAIDIPSGVNADTGEVMGIAFKADTTITFCIPKRGMYLYPGRDFCGNIIIKDIGIPEEAIRNQNIKINLTTLDFMKKIIKPRLNNTHKGTYGSALIIGGSRGFTGAPVLSASGALYSGAGLITAALPQSLHDIAENKLTEVMTFPLKDKDFHISQEAIPEITSLMAKSDALAIGMGLGTISSEEGLPIIKTVLNNNDRCKTVVIDADGLNLISNNPEVLLNKSCNVIITPHPGEMARLTNMSVMEVEKDRIGVSTEFSKRYNVCVVLKGNCTIIVFGDEVYINTTGNPGMAQGGSGDVLSGIIASFAAQRINPFYAAVAGVYIHGLSGDLLKKELCDYGISASEIAKNIPLALKNILGQ